MARYFFDIDNGDTRTWDEEGFELPNIRAMRDQAIGVLPDIVRTQLSGGDRRTLICQVRDGTNRLIFKAPLSLVAEWISRLSASDLPAALRPWRHAGLVVRR